MEIKTAAVIGLGALGVIFTRIMTKAAGKENILVLGDTERMERCRRDGVYFNGELCDFNYHDASLEPMPIDLIIVSTKYGGLHSVIETIRPWVGKNTLILSAINGILSEGELRAAFGEETVIDCVAQKMSAIKEGNKVIVSSVGELAFGETDGRKSERVLRVARFFDRVGMPYTLPSDMRHHLWGKLLCNVGLNQVCMVGEGPYSLVQTPGEPRRTMISAMEEVVAVANACGVDLSAEDIDLWLGLIDSLDPVSEPSMRQDGKAHRKTEVELFAGTIRRLGSQHGVPTPVNDMLYGKIKEMEASW